MEGRKRADCRIQSAFPYKQSAKQCVRNERFGWRNEREGQEDRECNCDCKPATKAKSAEAAARVGHEWDQHDPDVGTCVNRFGPFSDPKTIFEGQIGGD